ncbi:uncharacterized protein EV420DRAFT_1478545 [Desarmillaria tabescens]|uniref:Uncharacterized protein n=1 Tax=Armillaria tabescens TaxID=1929756 RepID=A0AA39KH98_ARMTA|nr:uncharacterized protein EV420DRAFT_1478545 [Desarmillaria tabescens]KAK0460005.1 hypothetical protein EV420DRAFT_1478545 [Desarmillaria tabescens]
MQGMRNLKDAELDFSTHFKHLNSTNETSTSAVGDDCASTLVLEASIDRVKKDIYIESKLDYEVDYSMETLRRGTSAYACARGGCIKDAKTYHAPIGKGEEGRLQQEDAVDGSLSVAVEGSRRLERLHAVYGKDVGGCRGRPLSREASVWREEKLSLRIVVVLSQSTEGKIGIRKGVARGSLEQHWCLAGDSREAVEKACADHEELVVNPLKHRDLRCPVL